MALYVGVFAIGSTNTATKINSAASHMAPGEVGKKYNSNIWFYFMFGVSRVNDGMIWAYLEWAA